MPRMKEKVLLQKKKKYLQESKKYIGTFERSDPEYNFKISLDDGCEDV